MHRIVKEDGTNTLYPFTPAALRVSIDLELVPLGRRGEFTCSNDFYLPSRRLEEGGGGQHPVPSPQCISDGKGRGPLA
jgi:hypothetical protein